MSDADDLLEEGLGYERGGALDRALEIYSRVLGMTADRRLKARALIRIAHTNRTRCQWDSALAAAAEAAATAEEARLDALLGESFNAEAAVYQSRGEFDRALATYERIREVTTDPRVLGMASQNSGAAAALLGDLDSAEKKFLEAHTFFAEAGEASGQAHVLNSHTAIALDRKEWALAEERGARAIEAAKRVGDLDLLAIASYNRAEALTGLGRFQEAEVLATAAIGQFQITGNTLGLVQSMRALGFIHVQRGNPAMASRVFTRALQLAEQIGAESEAARLRDHVAALPER